VDWFQDHLVGLSAGAWMALAAWLGSAFGREIAWAGRRYCLDREGRVTGLRPA